MRVGVIFTFAPRLRAALIASVMGLSCSLAGPGDAQTANGALGFAPAVAEAPQSVILTIESDVLFTNSAFGRRVAAEIEADSAVLSAENRRIEAELSAEEQSLTDRRASMEPAAFRALADAFDEKVQSNRQAQQAKVQELTQRSETARTEFMFAARAILEAMMLEAGANVILERSTVFLSANATDITELAITRIDAAIGDGLSSETADD